MVALPSSVALPSALSLRFAEIASRLAEVQHQARITGQGQILAMVFPIPRVDPLAVLQRLTAAGPTGATATGAQATTLLAAFSPCRTPAYFYVEKPWCGEVSLAWHPILHWQLAGPQRFEQAKQLLQSWQARIHGLNTPSGLAGRFFCSFSFREQTPSDAPFPAGKLFLPRWLLSGEQENYCLVCHQLIQPDTDLDQVWTDLQQEWAELPFNGPAPCALAAKPPALEANPRLERLEPLQSGRFKQSVQQALQAIATQKFAKLVLADTLDLLPPTPVDVVQSLVQLRQRYPDCYIFSTSNGRGQTFLGATPERLLSLQDGALTVDALAGSAPRGQTPQEDFALGQRLLNSDKEQREHRVLVDYIVATLRGLGLAANTSTPTRLLTLANIQHLQTLITASMPSDLHLLDILAQLHPTPAVAGFPRQIACEQIQAQEPFERGLYAAPLGWVSPQGEGEFVVGLRSALVDGQHLRLYAGAGIVAGSNPDREVQEIQLKLRALLESLVWQ
jgi:menaquinone-specific isochorismate synthase